MICSFLTYWAGLLKEDMQAQVIPGACGEVGGIVFPQSRRSDGCRASDGAL